jgi:hypothetical protein
VSRIIRRSVRDSVRGNTPEPVGRTAEGVLPDTAASAEPIAHGAKLFLKADLDSLG